ncbi:putative galactose mutarotase-like domain superfamily [Helianthus anomalus]
MEGYRWVCVCMYIHSFSIFRVLTSSLNFYNCKHRYPYSTENKDNQLHGWICSDPPVGFWMITPSNEFCNGGPVKQDLTSHACPITLSVSAH